MNESIVKEIEILTPAQQIVVNNQLTKEQLTAAPNLDGSVNWKKRIRPEEIKNYWKSVFGVEQLGEDETIRITAIRPWMNGEKLQGNQITLTDQIRNVTELITVIEKTYQAVENQYKTLVGFSISAGVYKYRVTEDGKGIAPGKEALIRINTMVMDLDSHVEQVGKHGRFHFNSFEEHSRRLIAGKASIKVNQILHENNIDLIIHSTKTYATGGGLQFHLKFERYLNAIEADNIFRYIRTALLSLSENKFAGNGVDALGNFQRCWLEFDLSCGDPTHTQRLGGTVNPKADYMGSFSEEIPDFYNLQLMDNAGAFLKNSVTINPNPKKFPHEKFESIKNSFLKITDSFRKNSQIDQEFIQIEHMKNSAYLSERENKFKSKNANELFGSDTYDIIKQIPVDEQAKMMKEIIYETYTTEQLESENNSSHSERFKRYNCPFHTETDPSFAIYQNNDGSGIARANDFHENGNSYNLIEFIIAVAKHRGKERTTQEVVGELKLRFSDIVIKQTDKKNIQKEANLNSIDLLIDRVNVEDYIYYRLANKQRACIIREFEHGESHVFDGTHMMSDHILINQLGMTNTADKELRALFHERFIEKILINAFEEFRPGKPHTYERHHIKYINLWIPGKEYLKIHEMAESLDEMDIASALGIIKNRLPNIWFYLNQITQKGNLEYFLNWLICISQFKTMSTIPIITSVQGTGKGLFVTHFLERYLNHEYVNIVNSEKMANNFNSFMERSSLIVMDEGDFSGTHDVDNLKMLSGNKYIQIEKKGIDSMKVERQFNMIMLTNGETPMRHPSNDRRISYFRLEVPLIDSIKQTDFEQIDDYMEAVDEEVLEFWSILVKTQTKKEWNNMNLKDNQFNKQILLMHPFGKLVLKILEDDWGSIKLQMNENVDDPLVITSNIEMIETIKSTYEQTGEIDLTLINKYIKSLNYKTFTGVQQFIDINILKENGIHSITNSQSVKIRIEKEKIKNLIYMKNNLGDVFDCYKDENIEHTMSDSFRNNRVTNEKLSTAQLQDFGMQPISPVLSTNNDPLGIAKPALPNTVVQ